MWSSKSFLVAAAAAVALLAGACAKHTGVMAPTIKDPVVFDDGYGASVDYQAFLGSRYDAVAIDSNTAYSGATSLRITVPASGDPNGSYAGGAFTTSRARDLSAYDALTFWARADRPVTLDVCGLGNDNTGTSRYEAKRTNLPLTTTWTRFVLPLPLASKLADEKGLFFFAEGPEAGQGSTIWIDDLTYATLGTVLNPRPSMPTVTLAPDVGSNVQVAGTQVTFAVDGTDQTEDVMQGYFTFASSDNSVATGGEGTIRVTGLGSATVTATMGSVPVTGALTITPNPAPSGPAPTPTVPAANVTSLFSNAYTNVAVDTWSATWDNANVADVQLAGNDTKKYTNFVFAGIEFTGSHVIDAGAMTHFHLDVWAATGTTFRVKLVDFGANGIYGGGDDHEHDLTLNGGTTPAFTTGAWSSLEIPLTSFTNLTTRGHVAQLILAGDVGTFYVDNIYFHN